MNKRLSLLAMTALLAACNPQGSEPISLGAPAQKALKTTELSADGKTRLKTLEAQTDLTNHTIFSSYRANANAQWSNNWTRRIDFTGVSWQRRQAGTAITPRHVVFAAHYPVKTGVTITFHDRAGNPHQRTLTERISLRKNSIEEGRSDITVVLLDSPLPPSIKPFRLLPPRTDYEYTLPETPVIVTEQKRRAFIHKVSRPYRNIISFRKNESFSESLYKNLIKGDSGHPSFILVGGEPVLIETHSVGGSGSGPFYSSPAVFKALEKAVAELDSNYRIKTVPLNPELAPAPPQKEKKNLSTTNNQNSTRSPSSPYSPRPRLPRVRRVPTPTE